ncbi:MAG: DUF397 domain-containing protein [Trebonia sp.]
MPHSSESERLDWRKAKRSMNNGNCAEIATAVGGVAVRDSNDRQGPVLRYPVASWTSFIAAARNGSLDSLY